jgi:Flp pilus assembly pilin Flp
MFSEILQQKAVCGIPEQVIYPSDPKYEQKGRIHMIRFKNFLRDESGMEFLQVAVIVLIVAALAVAIVAIGKAIKTKADSAATEVGGINTGLN